MNKFCPKCWNREIFVLTKYCTECGERLVEWDLKCECAEPISSSNFEVAFGYRIFTYKFCTKCGRRTDKIAKDHARYLQRHRNISIKCNNRIQN